MPLLLLAAGNNLQIVFVRRLSANLLAQFGARAAPGATGVRSSGWPVLCQLGSAPMFVCFFPFKNNPRARGNNNDGTR